MRILSFDAYFSACTIRHLAFHRPIPSGPPTRKLGPAPSNRRAATLGKEAPEINPLRSHPLGLCIAPLAQLALDIGPRPAGHGCAWHRKGFRWFWNWKVRQGRPAPSSPVRCGISSAGCAERIPLGVHRAFTANCSNSVSTSGRPALPSTWCAATSHHLKAGAPSWRTTSHSSFRSISLRSRL